MTEPFFDHPYFKGLHEPNRMEVDAPDLVVIGSLPDDLEGVFYRNGAEPLYPPMEGDYHWFEGDGMVYAFQIVGGRVSMRSRWVRTDKFNLEHAAGRRLFGMFGNPMSARPEAHGTRYNTANTNVILHGGKLLALMEGAPAVALDPRTLDTIGEDQYDGRITSTFSAHPTIDHNTGEMFNLGAMINGVMGKPEIRYDIISRGGKVTKSEIFEIPYMSAPHTFFLTENWAVFPIIPIDNDVKRMQEGGPFTAWVNGRPTLIGIMPRYGTPDEMRWLEMEPRSMFHELNVWEEGDRLFADVAAADRTPLFPDETGKRTSFAEAPQSLRRWEIDLSGRSNHVRETTLNQRDMQFPRADDRMMSRKTRQSFSNVNAAGKDRSLGMDSILRFDTESGVEDIYTFEAGRAVGEVVFAPRTGSREEADGYAMALVQDPANAKTQLVVFDAHNIAAGPIAQAVVPYMIPWGFHCNYYSSDSALYREAFA
jgi:carotenoid cleavage dioxygenase-like enzyme